MSMATYSSHTLPVRGRGSSGVGSAGLMEKIHEMLTERECSIFDEGLAAYHKRKDVNRFVESLSLVLNTNSKRQLLVTIRNTFIKPSDLIKFNDLCIKYGLALPLKGNTTKNAKKMFNKTQTGPKVYELKRDDKGEWGFSIRGGIDHGIGIFVSWVDRGSNAEKAGLKIGDYIHRVNEVGLEGLTFAQATQIFRNRSKIRMVITSYGRIPGFQFANKSYRWVDRDGKPVSPPTEVESLGMTTSGHVDPNVRTVNLSVDSGKVLGISIRGGAEHGLGIYISGVDAGSVADTNGIKRGEQILEVNGVSYINILHPDAAKGLKEERAMVMRLKDIGKLPHSKIPPPPPVQAWQMQQQPQMTTEPSVTRSVKSLPGTMKRSTEYTDSKKPGEGGTPVMITKRTISPGRGIMNEVAESLLTKAEMTTFTYYITRYEHNQINVESLVQYLLKLLNTDKKMGLIAEVRNIIREQDLDAYNELTATRELQSFRVNKSFNDSDDEDMAAAAVHAINGIQNKDERDDDSLDDVPQRIVPVTFHPPPPPPGGPDTSTPQLLAMTMKDRRRNLHESVLEDESWDDSTLPRPIPMFNEDTMQKKLQDMKQEVEEKLKKEYEEELEAKLKAEKEELERQKAEMRAIQEEKEEIEKQLQNMSSGEDKEKLEEEIWRQAEESLRQELTDQIQKESKEKMKEEYDKLLETSLAEERKKTEAERKMREELELKQREKNILEREREEQKRIEMEEKARRGAEEKARREYEQRLQRESEEKARLAEEVKSYRSMKIELENEKDQRERLERAKKTAERKAEEEEAEKERIRNKLKKEKLEAEEKAEKEESEKKKIEKKLKREKEEAEEKAEREEAEKRKLKALLEKKEKELQEKEREQAEAALLLQKQKEQEKRKSELQREAEEEERLRQEQQKAKQEEEKRKRRQERELARQAEEERKRRLREEEERKLQQQQQEAEEDEEEDDEEEERRQREEEEEAKRQRQEAEKRQKEEEKRRKEEEKRKKEEERQRKEEERRRKEEEKRQREEEKRQREEEEKRQREEERRQREEEEREREEEERLRMEEKRLSKEGSFFDPVLMDELVISSSPSQALPTQNTSKPHVTFEDQKKKEQKIIENERKLAEQMLAVRLREKKNEPKEEGRISFAGYTNLKGELKKVTIKKVNKKLGIAVDGGANTKQKAVIVRQIVPDGSAALSGKDLEIGQQILAVNGKSLKGLKHKDAVLAIKNAFDGPMQKVIEFDMLVAED